MKRPYEDIIGTPRDRDYLLSLNEAALAHRNLIVTLANHIYTGCLIGDPPPKTRRMLQRITSPRIGDLVFEQTRIYRQKNPGYYGLGYLIEIRTEWVQTDKEYKKELESIYNAMYPEETERLTQKFCYIQYGPKPEDICRWHNYLMLKIPDQLHYA